MHTPIKDELFISVDRESNSEIKVGEKTLFLDTSYNRNLHVRIHGKVEQTPLAIRVWDEYGKYKGTRPYSKQDPQIGETVYFHFHTVSNYNKFVTDEGQTLYRLNYPQIFCVIRDGKIVMVNNRVLVTPVYEPWENCFTAGTKLQLKEGLAEAKTPEDFDIMGFGMQIKTAPAPIQHAGIIRHCGEYEDLKPGDSIMFSKDSEFENIIEGEMYYVMKKDDVIAHYNPLENIVKIF